MAASAAIFRHPALLNAREPDPEAAAELGQGLRPHVEGVPAAELAEGLRVGCAGGRQRRELGEELLEAGRGDELEDPRRLVAGVPERVPLAARLVDQVARARLHDVVAEQRAHAALEDEA